MEILNVQGLSLMLLLMTIHAAPVVKHRSPTYLKQIKDEADALLKNETAISNVSVPCPPVSQDGQLCVPHYFCYAEKSLHTLTVGAQKIHHLKELLKHYNKNLTDTHCPWDKSESFPLTQLIKDISKCADHHSSKNA